MADRVVSPGSGIAFPVLDQWAPLSHKTAVGDDQQPATIATSWVPPHERRRLAAYLVLQAYADNVARYYLPRNTTGMQERRELREYGHGGLVVDQALSALLGDEQTAVVDPLETDPSEDGDPGYDDATAARSTRQSWLSDWAGDERLSTKVNLCERKAVTLGDGVYVLAWSATKARVVLRVEDPGFFFPVQDPEQVDDDFPNRVHLAWEYETHSADGKTRRWLRRQTWSREHLVATDPGATPVPMVGGQEQRWPDTGVARFERRYAWQDADEPPSQWTVRFSDATWEMGRAQGRLDDLSLNAARFAVSDTGQVQRELDLSIDFIPVVHIPNTDEGGALFGRAILLKIAQVLDDLAQADTDLATVALDTAASPLVTKGAGGGDLSGGPGARYDLPANASAEYLDTSKNLVALIQWTDRLLEYMSTNSRLAPAILGRIGATHVPSGVALALQFGPTQSLVRELRRVRDEKYPLLLKMVQRLAVASGQLPVPVYPCRLALGSYLPADQVQAVTTVTQLLAAHAISRITAVKLLIDAGFRIGDAEAEVSRIEGENFSAAVQLLDATGDEAIVRDFLGLDPPTVSPPVPGPGPGPGPGPSPLPAGTGTPPANRPAAGPGSL